MSESQIVQAVARGTEFQVGERKFTLKPFSITIQKLEVKVLEQTPYYRDHYRFRTLDVRADLKVVSVTDGNMMNLRFITATDLPSDSDEPVPHIVFHELQKMVLHELAKCLLCDGEHIREPHPERFQNKDPNLVGGL